MQIETAFVVASRARTRIHQSLYKLLSPVTVTDGFACWRRIWGRGFQNLVLYMAVTDAFCVLRFECLCRARRFENVAPIVRVKAPHQQNANIREQLSTSSTC